MSRPQMFTDAHPLKPRLRGVLHQFGAAAAAGAGSVLASMTAGRAFLAVGVFTASLVLLFTVSAVYHRIDWAPRPRKWMRRADHAMIFVLIAGTSTPIAVLGLEPEISRAFLWTVWLAASVGIVRALFWVHAPKWLTAALGVAVGWLVVPYMGDVRQAYGDAVFGLILGGGIAYSLGAVTYASRRPALWPRVFGYHEAFHLLTLVGAGVHFEAIRRVVFAGALAS